MTTIYTLTIKQQGRSDYTSYFITRSGAEDCRHALLTKFFTKHLRTGNKIKGALRGRGRHDLAALAAGIVAENIQFVITKAYLRGDAQ